jgi:endonuclease-8
MPEGDTILSIAGRLRPVLVDRPLQKVETPQRRHALDRWPEKLAGARIRSIDTHGKHLFLRWDNGLTIHSHLRMSGRWRIFERPFDVGRRARAAWLVLETGDHTVVQFRGPVLELIKDGRLGYDPYLRRLGPYILA